MYLPTDEVRTWWRTRRRAQVAARLPVAILGALSLVLNHGWDVLLVGVPGVIALVACCLGGMAVYDRRLHGRRATGVLHRSRAVLEVDDTSPLLDAAGPLKEWRRGLLRGQLPGTLDIAPDELRWAPGRMARWAGVRSILRVPFAGTMRVAVVPATLPSLPGIDVELHDGTHVTLSARDADALRNALQRTARPLSAPAGAAPSWEEDPSAALRSPLPGATRVVLAGAWAVTLALVFGPLSARSPGESVNGFQDAAVAGYFAAALVAVVLVVARSRAALPVTLVAALCALIASLFDFAIDEDLARDELVIFGAFLAVAGLAWVTSGDPRQRPRAS